MAQKKTSKKSAAGKKGRASGAKPGGGAGKLPHAEQMENAFGVDMSKFDLRTQHDGFKPSAIGANAYANGEKVAFKGGAEASQGLIGHEAAHTVQQRAGGVGRG